MILIVIMLLPPLRTAKAAGFNYYTSIYIDKYPDKLDYYVGESFDKTGMRIYGNRVKADGSKDVSDLGLDGLIASPSTFTKAGSTFTGTAGQLLFYCLYCAFFGAPALEISFLSLASTMTQRY